MFFSIDTLDTPILFWMYLRLWMAVEYWSTNSGWDQTNMICFVPEWQAVLDWQRFKYQSSSPQRDMAFYRDTLFWLRADQSLTLLLIDVCIAESHRSSEAANINLMFFGLTRSKFKPITSRNRGNHALTRPLCCVIFVHFYF